MNEKTAKKIRRMARATGRTTTVTYVLQNTATPAGVRSRRRVSPNCERGIIKMLKHMYKQGVYFPNVT